MLYRMFVGCSRCDCVSSYTSVSGVYEITSPVTNNPILVECVMKDGYGYTVSTTEFSHNFSLLYPVSQVSIWVSPPFGQYTVNALYLSV